MSASNSFGFLSKNPNFARVWLGQVLSQSGGRMSQIAIVWWIVSGQQQSGQMVGLFMVVAALPSLLFVNHIGAAIDRISRRSLLVRCDFAAALVLGTLAFVIARFDLPVWAVFPVGFLTAALQAVIDPTLNKSVAEVVEPGALERGVSWMASTQSLANFAGAVVGAMWIGVVGVGGTIGCAALGYLISAWSSSRAEFRQLPPVGSAKADEGFLNLWRWLGQFGPLRKLLVGFGFVNFFATPTLVVLPLYTKKMLEGTAQTLGLLEACLWLGLITGTFLAPRIGDGGSRIRIGAMCLLVFGVCLVIPGVWVSLPLYGLSLATMGMALGINNVKFLSLFQEWVPDEMKGRFFALMQAVIGFSFPVAYGLFGVLTDLLLTSQVCVIQGIGVIALSLFFFVVASAGEKQCIPKMA